MQSPHRFLSSQSFLFVAIIVTAINLLSMPGTQGGGDAMYVRYEAITLINHGTIAIPPQVGSTGDQGQFFYYNASKKRWYSKYGILNTLMFLPALYAEKLLTGELHANSGTRVLTLNCMNLVLALAMTAYLFKFTGFYAKSLLIRIAWILSVFYCTFWWNYLRYPSFEAYQPFLLIGSTYHLIRALDASAGGNEPSAGKEIASDLFLSGLLLGLLFLSKALYVIVAALFPALIVILEWNRLHRFSKRLGIHILWLCAPLFVCFCVLLGANYYKFGSPLNTGYTQWQREHHLFSGDIFEGLAGFLFDPQFSIFLTFPVLIAALFGLPEFFRKHRPHAIVIYSLATLLILANAKFLNWRGQWAYGPRYMLPALGMMSLPFLFVIERLVTGIRKPAQIPASLAVVAMLGFSVKLQLNTNAVPFYALHAIHDMAIDPLHDAELEHYFAVTPMGMINGDLLEYKRNHPTWLTLKAAQDSGKDREALKRLSMYFRDYTVSNYYFFPDRVRAAGTP